MAEEFARRLGLDTMSAGTLPSPRLNQVVVEAMRERGIDMSTKSPKILTSEMIADASLVVTMGCSVQEICPRPMLAQMQKKLVDWELDDPKGKTIEEVRRIRDEIEERVRTIAESSSQK